MKRQNHPRWAFALLMSAALLVFTPGLTAQSSTTAPDQGQAGAAQQSKTFSGTVMKLQNGKYALVTGKTPQGQLAGHFLDDENDAKKYEGKEVKVTGTLDMASNTIHVTRIEAA
jgi:hypothetical protein